MNELLFKRGDRVIYSPYKGCATAQLERGIVKRVSDDGEIVFVLYHTRSMQFTEADLDNYTAAATCKADLSRDASDG